MVEGYGPADSSKTLNGCTRHKADICHSFFSDHYQLLSHAQQSGQLEPNVTYSGSGFWIWTLGPRISDLESRISRAPRAGHSSCLLEAIGALSPGRATPNYIIYSGEEVKETKPEH